jgi:pimeloyl-ACP methyl ester carboxylesterase
MTEERFADVATGVRLCYQEFGDPAGDPLLLVMGLGTQMIGWPDEFCAQLGDRGFRVIRFDNRDIGRSTKLREVRPPGIGAVVTRSRRAAAYLLGDMADDAAGLLDALEIDAAHVVGASMGGMIAQTLAARHGGRVRSLASIMSNTGHRFSGQPALSVYPLFLRPRPAAPELAIQRMVDLFDRVGSTGFDRDEAELRAMITRSIERADGGSDQAGTARQLQAILASGDRTAELRRITAPTVVIHGTADKLVRPSGGKATHKAIAGSELVLVNGMGHDLPRGAWPEILDAIAANAARAGAGAVL